MLFNIDIELKYHVCIHTDPKLYCSWHCSDCFRRLEQLVAHLLKSHNVDTMWCLFKEIQPQWPMYSIFTLSWRCEVVCMKWMSKVFLYDENRRNTHCCVNLSLVASTHNVIKQVQDCCGWQQNHLPWVNDLWYGRTSSAEPCSSVTQASQWMTWTGTPWCIENSCCQTNCSRSPETMSSKKKTLLRNFIKRFGKI